MKTDIEGRTELETLVNSFYERVKQDDILGPLFGHVNWDRHLPVMYSFWENALFYSGGYYGNPLKVHQGFHKKQPLGEAHFERWLNIFTNTTDALFEGPRAKLAKEKAKSISAVMWIKIGS